MAVTVTGTDADAGTPPQDSRRQHKSIGEARRDAPPRPIELASIADLKNATDAAGLHAKLELLGVRKLSLI